MPRGTLEPDRLRLILHRLATNFYDTTEVYDRIAARVGRDLP